LSSQASPLPPGSLVWSYLRVSGDEQADRGVPIAGQREMHQRYANENGLVITRWFIDEAKSGSSTAGRDDFNEMIYLARQKPLPVDGILLWDIKRFARNLLDSQFYKADLRRRGYTLIFLSDDIPQTDFAPVYETILEWKAQKDLEQLAKDIRRGLHYLARLGYAPGGFPPRGYRAEQLKVEIEGKQRTVRRWAPDPDHWDLARKAWAMRANGASYREIIEETRLFRSDTCLPTFFRNKTYLGIRKCGQLEIEHAHHAMITQETWDAVQARRHVTGPRRKAQSWEDGHPRRARSRYLLSGLLYCSECGAAMSGSYTPDRHLPDGHRRPWLFYICGRKSREGYGACPSSRLKAERIESAVLDRLLRDVLTVDHINDMIRDTNAALGEQHEALEQNQKRLQREIAQLDKSIARLIDALESGESGAVHSRLESREREQKELEGRLAAVDEQLQRSRIELSRDALEQLLNEMHTVLNEGDVGTRRRLLRAFVVRIEAGRKGGVMYYTFPFATGI